MPATPAWYAATEALLNRHIDASGEARSLARRLDATSLLLDVVGVTRVIARISQGRLSLTVGAPEEAVDASISGSPLTLLQLATGGKRTSAGGDGAQVRGDAEVAAGYRSLFAAASPDFEEELSRLIGDLPARRAAQFARSAIFWLRRSGRTAGENLTEYLQEESRDLVGKTELDEFLRGVDELREAADRVEARLARLERRFERST